MSPNVTPSHLVEWCSLGSCGLTLPPGRGPNTRCCATVLLSERAIASGVLMAAARLIDVTWEVVGDGWFGHSRVDTSTQTDNKEVGITRRRGRRRPICHTIRGRMVDARRYCQGMDSRHAIVSSGYGW